MFWGVIGIYWTSSAMTGLFSAVKSLATVRRSSFTLEGFSTVPPDFTEVLIVVSSALSSEILFFRSSGSICLISRLRSIANGLLLLRFYWLRLLRKLCNPVRKNPSPIIRGTVQGGPTQPRRKHCQYAAIVPETGP